MTVDADAVILLPEAAVLDFLKMLKKSGFLISKASQPKMAKRLKQLLPVKVRFTRTLSCDIRIASYTIDHQAINNAKKIRIFGTPLPVATPEDVIIYKLVRFEDIDKEVGDEGVYHNLQEILRWMRRTNERANL